ncbi:MAG: DUF1573 domain-containing protein [Spirochaetales bacterium]|nr:DUF1573 domain-containing protein [Spirochaetales bacterium]
MIKKGIFFSLLLLFIGVLVVFSCKNNLMDILEAPEISVLFDGEKISKTDSIRLNSIPLGGTLECTITITNKGRTSKLIFPETDALELTGSNIDQFSISVFESRELLPGESISIILTFSPAGSIGEKQAEIIIKSNDKNESTFSFSVIGTAIASDSDLLNPTAILSSEVPSITNSAPIPVNLTFNEEVVGFSISMLTVINANAESLHTEDNIVFTFDLTNPSNEGTISVYLPSGEVPDIAGNLNTAAPLLSFTYDTIHPGVSIEADDGSPTNIHPIPITITFTEEVSGFDESDIVISPAGASINTFDNSANPIFTAKINTGGSAMDVTLNITSDAGTDTAGNGSSALSSPITISYDDSIPTVEISSSAGTHTNIDIVPITFTFSEEIEPTTFTTDDITIIPPIALGAIDYSNNPIFTVELLSLPDGTIGIYLAAGEITTPSGSGNNASDLFEFVYDSTQPTVSIESSEYVGDEPFDIYVNFSEEVTGFETSDIEITTDPETIGAIVSSLTTSNDKDYTVEIDVTDGPVDITVNIPANAVQDITGNESLALHMPKTITFNDDFPTTTITSTNGQFVNVNPTPITITFSENMDNFEVGDITTDNCSITGFQTTNSQIYSLNINFPTDPAESSISISDGVARASGGDQLTNAGSGIFNLTYDATIPTGIMVIDDGNEYTNLTTVNLSLTADGTGTNDPEMILSNDPDFFGAEWEPFSGTVEDWVIDDSGSWNVGENPADITRTVYYKLKDKCGNISVDYSESIIQTPHGVFNISIFGGAVFK